jgi:hypothetical protein
MYYERGDLPIAVSFHGATRKLVWKVEVEVLDYHHYLPIFFDGLREVREPYNFLVSAGIDDLLTTGPSKVLPVLPQLIIPMKLALNTKHPQAIVTTLNKIQKLVQCGESVAEALVPYYRQILPVLNMFKSNRINIGDSIHYGQYKNEDL